MIRVCFVCLGNICRSPTAEACFTDLVARAGLSDRFTIDSAGTGSWHVGEPAHAETRATATRRGVDVRSIARQFVPADFARFDYVLAMDKENQKNLLRMAPDDEARAKVHLYRDFDPASRGEDVPDPYYEGCFDEVFDVCLTAAQGLLDHLRETHGL